MRTLLQDLRFGSRLLLHRPAFTLAAVLTLALGVAANTTVFGWIDVLLVHPFPGVSDGRRLASIETLSPRGEYSTTSWRDYLDYRDGLTLASGVAASLFNTFAVGDESPQRVTGEYVSSNYFSVLGVRPALGRAFMPGECADTSQSCPVAVIGYALWKQRYHGDRAALGQMLRVNRHPLTIVGVAPEDFHGSMPGMTLGIWIPMTMAPALNGQGDWLLTDRAEKQMWITARLKPGVTVEQANAEVEGCARRIAAVSPSTSAGFSARLMPIWKAHVGLQGFLLTPLRILMGVCGVVFLIVAANVSNLQLARATSRRREFSVRLALGAGSGRVIRQLVTESALIAAAGAAVGVALAVWLARGLEWMLPRTTFPISLDFSLNADILAFAILLALVLAVLTGLAPALQSMRVDVNETLKEGGRSGTPGASLQRIRGALVMAEVALAMVALIGMGLFTRSFLKARNIDPGIETKHLLLVQYHVDTFCSTKEQREQFCLRLRDRLSTRPGIKAVGYSLDIPLAFGNSATAELQIQGYTPRRKEEARANYAIVSPGYFDALGIPLISGRDFSEQDRAETAQVGIVNQTFARRFFGGRDPVGGKVRGQGPWITIVGVVKDSKYRTLGEASTPYAFVPFRQSHGGEFWTAFFIRTVGPARDQIAAVRREAAMLEPVAAVFPVMPFDDHVSASLFPQRVAATLLTVLGAIALVLAALGLYSVLAFMVGQREHEFGVRRALGAQSRDVLAIVFRQGMLLTLAGLAAGTALALIAARFLGSLLVNLNPNDPLLIGGVSLFLAAVALLACYIPARHATKVDPFAALRDQ